MGSVLGVISNNFTKLKFMKIFSSASRSFMVIHFFFSFRSILSYSV